MSWGCRAPLTAEPGGPPSDIGWPRPQRTWPCEELGALHAGPCAGLPGGTSWESPHPGSQAAPPTSGLGSTIMYLPQELPSQRGTTRAQRGALKAPLKPGSQPPGPPSIPQNPQHRPLSLGQLLPDPGRFPRGNGPRHGPPGPGRAQPPLKGAPRPPPSPTMCQSREGPSPDLPHPPSAPRGRKKAAGGGTWGFISILSKYL